MTSGSRPTPLVNFYDHYFPEITQSRQISTESAASLCPFSLPIFRDKVPLKMFQNWPTRCFLSLGLCSVAACSPSPEVTTISVARHTVESTIVGVSSGTVKAEQSAELAFGAVGRVSSLNVKLGDAVKKGDLLAEIENDDARTTLQVAEAELKRRETMGSLAVSKSDYDSARVAVGNARVQLDRTLIRAPYDGVISEVNLEVGQLSQITAVIPKPPLRITDVAPRYVRVDIDEVDLPRAASGLPARIKIPAVRREPFPAVVRKVVPFVNSVREQDRTSELELAIDAPNTLLPAGASADVEIIVQSKSNVVGLPSRAVFGRGNERFIYTITDNKLTKVPVKVGINNYDYTELLSGAGEGIVAVLPSDTVELKDGLKVKIRTGNK